MSIIKTSGLQIRGRHASAMRHEIDQDTIGFSESVRKVGNSMLFTCVMRGYHHELCQSQFQDDRALPIRKAPSHF